MYPGSGEQAVRILPILDRLLLFWSERRNPHEIEPSHDVRWVDVFKCKLNSMIFNYYQKSNFPTQRYSEILFGKVCFKCIVKVSKPKSK